MRKKAVITPLGMNRDLAMSKFDARFAYENKNLRLITDKETSKFVMTNERGPAKIDASVYTYDTVNHEWKLSVTQTGPLTELLGHAMGCAVISNHLVVFTHDVYEATGEDVTFLNRDRIYRVDFEDDTSDGRPVKCYELFRGNLGFDLSYPIETLPFYETEDIQKVYWTDGKNQPRVINIMAAVEDYTTKSFDFAQEISGHESISVTRKDNTNGLFPSGVVQYAFTYYRKYGQESSVAAISPLCYIADDERGSAPDETVACSFKITLSGLSKKYDGVRIYSIIRTSTNAMPLVKRLADISIKGNGTYGQAEYIDNNSGEDVEATYLLYVGAKEITCETMTQKDNTAFYGNIKIKNGHVGDELRNKIRTRQAFTSLAFANNKEITLPQSWGKYNFNNQLRKNADAIRFFQYRETYRFGVQLQDKYGNWSDVIRIESGENDNNDFYQGLAPTSDVKSELSDDNDVLATSRNDLKRMVATFNGTLDLSQLDGLIDDYIAIRPVVVYPGMDDRSVLAQGVLTPTVYNLEDRVNNGTYGQMSWFSRPICSEEDMFPATDDPIDLIPNIKNPNQITDYKVLEFRNYRPLPPTNQYAKSEDDKWYHGSAAELLCNFESYKCNVGTNKYPRTIDYTFWANVAPWQEKILVDNTVVGSNPNVHERATQLRSVYFVDQTVDTFHSPDVEYTDLFAKMDMESVKMRIVGVVPVTYQSAGVYMAADEITYKNGLHIPERDFQYGGETGTHYAYKQFTEFGGVQANFEDKFTSADDDYFDEGHKVKASYWGTNKVYPWHTKTLTHEITGFWPMDDRIKECWDTTDMVSKLRGRRRTSLAKKIYDSLHYSYDTVYLSNAVDIDIDTPTYFNSVDGPIDRIKVDGTYYNFDFNVDKVVVPNTRVSSETEVRYVNGFIYPGNGDLYVEDQDATSTDNDIVKTGSSMVCSNEGIPMQYKGTSSIVMHLESDLQQNGTKLVQALPRIVYGNAGHYNFCLEEENGTVNDRTQIIEWAGENIDPSPLTGRAITPNDWHFMWDEDAVSMWQKSITADSALAKLCTQKYGIFYLAELYRDIDNKFGGDSEEAIAANDWIPCGAAVSLEATSNNSTISINWTIGDTYYQRYDNLHTYPNTEDDINQIVDIVSFMCETRVNIDGRYDRNRGLDNNRDTRPTNMNRLNGVYGQDPNYFKYRAIDHNRIVTDAYPVTVAWTKTKQLGEYVDSWTNVTLANTLDMDGSKGPVRALRRHFDDILAFQDTGISRILFNEQQAVQTEAGVPLEIANSGKVTGHHYISPIIGCHNKWSIASSPYGTYFMDDVMQDIMIVTSERQIKSVAADKGFRSWARAKADIAHRWNLEMWDCIRSYYDKNNSEVMFVTKDDALSFSEQLGQFTSFYDYNMIGYLETVQRHHVMMRNIGTLIPIEESTNARTQLYEHNKGEYNKFFGEYKTFWTELICHSDGTEHDSPLLDKTWTNVSFQFDTFDDSKTDVKERYKESDHFDKVECWTEYQEGVTDWSGRYPGIAKKFRMWNADLPRDGYTIAHQGHTADRFRNPWLKMRLSKYSVHDWRSVLHSVTIGYLE